MRKLDKYVKIIDEKFKEYELIDYIPSGSVLDGVKVTKPYLKLKCKNCKEEFNSRADGVTTKKIKCSRCCGSYERSFAYHVEKELGLNIGDIWDFEKNMVNPYHISRSFRAENVWFKCTVNNEHDSYKSTCDIFIRGCRCPYCNGKKINKINSFAQYHIDNTDPNFLEKYWDWDKNNELGIDPWKISPNSNKIKVWIKCKNEDRNSSNNIKKSDYHGSYHVTCNNFTQGKRCPYCANRPSSVKYFDSFGYNNPCLAQMWANSNLISPYRVANNSNNKFKFICDRCGGEVEKQLDSILYKGFGCSKCNQSTGEKIISDWLISNNIEFIYDKPYFKDLVGLGGGLLRPDFILEKEKIWIEYDGEFHFGHGISSQKQNSEQLIAQQQHDTIKEKYAEKNGWDMIRIAYWDKDIIEDILDGRVLGLITNKYLGVFKKEM